MTGWINTQQLPQALARPESWRRTVAQWAAWLRAFFIGPGALDRYLGLALVLTWGLVVLRVTPQLPTQPASWLTFVGLLITPGYFLGEMVGWRLRLDLLERLALALPLGMAVLAVPGTIALVQHRTLDELTLWWIIAGGLVLGAWLVQRIFFRSLVYVFDGQRFSGRPKWAWDELLMVVLLAVAFLLILPTLNLDKIDGDAYAVATFTADALAGLPLNEMEPIFGTDLGPGVRMVFNQFLSLSYLWSYLSGIDPITLTAVASRSMLALWALFATYCLGKAAGQSRRFGLFVTCISMLIYLAAPFVRGDNVSLFYFERTNADKFMVPITMLPVVFAFAISFVRSGRWPAWMLAALSAFAVSTIHPLIAAMLALALGAFGGFHLLVNLRRRTAWLRTIALGGLVAIAMLLPVVQLVLSRGEAPLASSYPASFEGWPLGVKLIPVLPFVQIETIDLYGPLPALDQIDSIQANEADNPFLIWRFAVNMNRRRIILFDRDHYISDPSILLEPPYLLALFLLPLVIWRRWRDPAAQFVTATSLGILFVMFNPLVTPRIGALVMPWILWRFIWLLPYALIIGLGLRRILNEWIPTFLRWSSGRRLSKPIPDPVGARYSLVTAVVLAGLLLSGFMVKNVRNLHDRAASPYFYPAPPAILNYLQRATTTGAPATVLADADLSVTLPAYVARANIIAHRAPTTSEVFPADQQDVALQRLIDQDTFYHTNYLTSESVAILDRYDVQYIVTDSGSGIDAQLRVAADWFEWILNDQSYSLYRVRELPTISASIQANAAMAARNWTQAEEYFREALAADPQDPLALLGMADIAHARGQFEDALAWLDQAQGVVELPIVDYRRGLILVESGDLEAGIAALESAQERAPRVSRYHVALGDACLNAGRLDCAAEQYAAAAQYETLPDEAARSIAQADLWRQQDRPEMALPYYEEAVTLQPSEYNLFLLESAYREAGRFDRSATILAELRERHPYSPEVLLAQASAQAVQDNIDQAVALYEQAIALQQVLAQETADSYLALAQVLLAANRLDDARVAIDAAIDRRPYHPLAYRLQGELFGRQEQYEQAIHAYERAYQLDPTQIDTFIALSNMLQLHGGRQAGVVSLLQETIQANPDEAILFLALGDQLQSNGDPAGAVEAFNNALDRLDAYFLSDNLRPRRSSGEGRAFIYARMARAYEDLQESQTAINYYRAAVAAAPAAPWTHVLLGDAYHRGSDFGAAETAYLRALDSDVAYADAYIGLAELYMDSQRYTEAGEYLLLALEDNNQNLDPYMRLAELEQRRGNDQAALDWLRDAAAASTENRTVSIPLVDSLVRYGDYETAHFYLEEALVLRPTDADLMLRLGQLQRTMGQYALAEATLLKARRLNRDDSRVYAELGALYHALARPESAQQVYMQAIALQPGVASHHVALSQLWQARGNFDQAQAVLKAALPTVAPVEDIYIALSTLYAQQGELALAGETLQQGLDRVGESSPLLLALGRHYLALADYSLAQEQYKRVIALNGDAAAAYAALGDMYARRGDGDSAVVQFQAALALEPENATYHLGLAEALALAGRDDEALASYEDALTLLPTLETIYLSLGTFYSDIEQPADAWATYQQAMEMAPTSGRVLRRYALFLAGQEQEHQALTVLNRAVELDPSAATYIARANLQAMLEDYAAAQADLETARILEPGSVDVLIALGDLYRSQENYAEAEKLYTSVVNLVPNVPVGYLRLGNLAGLQGDLDAAQEYADAAREVAPGILNPPDDVAQ